MTTRPYILSVAGYDPSGGAGVLADVKTFEQHSTLGLAVTTCLTYQTEDEFAGIEWFSKDQVIRQLLPLLNRYSIDVIKIGLITEELLEEVLKHIPLSTKIVWDPVLSASANFDFENFGLGRIERILKRIELITPNLDEYQKLNLSELKIPITNVLLKGGHAKDHKDDELIGKEGTSVKIKGIEFSKPFHKHGTGCVLSSAVAANLALGNSLESACRLGKAYVEELLQSNDTKLGYHQK